MKKHDVKIVMLIAISAVVIAGIAIIAIVLPPKKTSGVALSIGNIDSRVGSHFSDLKAMDELHFYRVETNRRKDVLLIVGNASPESINNFSQSRGVNETVVRPQGFHANRLQHNIAIWKEEFDAPASILFYDMSFNSHGNEIYGMTENNLGSYRLFYEEATGYFILSIRFVP